MTLKMIYSKYLETNGWEYGSLHIGKNLIASCVTQKMGMEICKRYNEHKELVKKVKDYENGRARVVK